MCQNSLTLPYLSKQLFPIRVYTIPDMWHSSICLPSVGTLSSIRTDAQILRHTTSHIHSRGSLFPTGTWQEMECHQSEGWPSHEIRPGGHWDAGLPQQGHWQTKVILDIIIGYIEGGQFHSIQPLQKLNGSHQELISHSGIYFLLSFQTISAWSPFD